MSSRNDWPDGFPPVQESPSLWLHFVVAYTAGIGSDATATHWAAIAGLATSLAVQMLDTIHRL